MADYTSRGDLETGWLALLQVFPYENATQSKAELQASQAAAGMDKAAITAIIEWAAAENLIEPADEADRFRLMPRGRKSWRDNRDPV